VPNTAAAASEVRNDGGAAETMDEVGAAAAFAEGATLLPLAKETSPPRGPGARGMKSARAARPGPEEVRNSGDKPDRRMASTLRLPAPRLPTTWPWTCSARAGATLPHSP
jgi:hypothetical protein